MSGRRGGATRFEPGPAVPEPRRSRAPGTGRTPPVESGAAATTPARPAGAAAGKGRPTPRRRDAEAERRARARPPRSRREAAEQRRERARVERGRTRQAMITGDERGLPARDRGVVRRFVRDTVDARQSPLQYVLPVMVVLLLGSTVISSIIAKQHPAATLDATLVFYVLVLLFLGLAVRYGFELRRIVAARFTETGENTAGAVRYGVLRAVTLRRLRQPKPPRPR